MGFSKIYILLLTIGSVICFAADKVPPHNKTCKTYLRDLAACQSHFVQCTVGNSTPAMSCTSCFDRYTDMTNDYDKLSTECSDLYINQNRLNIVENMQKGLLDIWNKAFCYDCFDDGTISNSTKHFNNLENDFHDCVNTTPKNETCIHCKKTYIVLNDFYKKMDEEKKGKICFDSQDAMNRTRSLWSKELKCCRREYSLTLFIVASTLFGAVSILFYVGMYGYTKRLERNYEVLDSNYNAETREPVASTSAGAPSGTSANSLMEPEASTSATAAQTTNNVKKVNLPNRGQTSTSGENEKSLIVL